MTVLRIGRYAVLGAVYRDGGGAVCKSYTGDILVLSRFSGERRLKLKVRELGKEALCRAPVLNYVPDAVGDVCVAYEVYRALLCPCFYRCGVARAVGELRVLLAPGDVALVVKERLNVGGKEVLVDLAVLVGEGYRVVGVKGV